MLFLTTAVEGGGAEKHFLRIAPLLLPEAGNRLFVSLRTLPDPAKGLLTVPMATLGWQSALDYPKCVLRLARLARQHQVQLIYSFSRCANAVNYAATRLAGHRALTAMGVNRQPWFFYDAMPSLGGWFWSRMEAQALRQAELVLCNSASAAQQLVQRAGCSPAKVKVIRNPLPVRQIKTEAAAARARSLAGTGDAPFILSVGRFCEGKGFAGLIDAFGQIRDRMPHNLVLVGDGPLRDRLQQQVQNLGLEQRVQFVGWKDDPTPFLAHCRLFAFSSECEGLPNVVLEAMAAGAPVVATNCTSWIEDFAAREACLSVPVKDSTKLAHAMLKALQDEALCERLRTRASSLVDEFEAGAVADQRNAILRQVLAEHFIQGATRTTQPGEVHLTASDRNRA